jgi:hypothetical protein
MSIFFFGNNYKATVAEVGNNLLKVVYIGFKVLYNALIASSDCVLRFIMTKRGWNIKFPLR